MARGTTSSVGRARDASSSAKTATTAPPRRPVRRQLRWHGPRRQDPGQGPDLRAPLDPPRTSIPTTRSPGSTGPPASPTRAARSSSSRRTSRSPTSGASSPPTSSSASTSAATSARRSARPASASSSTASSTRSPPGPRPSTTSRPTRTSPTFKAELTHLLVHQKMAFNSPVWFNVGIEAKPQCSACFINSVEDTMSSIMDLAKTEAMLFKFGSGTGTDLSTLRSIRRSWPAAARPSGPVCFMRGYDAFAGVVKSGGKTRRAAKMVILNAGHPDVLEFIECKTKEEKKARALIEAGYESNFNGEAYSSVMFQNANHSRPRHRRLHAGRRERHRIGRPTRSSIRRSRWTRTRPARSWTRWPRRPGSAATPACSTTRRSTAGTPARTRRRINASNPCSEYMFLDDTACNLASINLMKFGKADGEFDAERFARGLPHLLTAQEILVDHASYPTPNIAREQPQVPAARPRLRQPRRLLMSRGLAYDSDEGAPTRRPSPRSCTARRT